MQKLLFGQLLQQYGGLDKITQDLDALLIPVLLYSENRLFLTCLFLLISLDILWFYPL